MRRLVPPAVVLMLVLVACGGEPRRGLRGSGDDVATVRLGTKNFTEQHVLGELYAQALRARGIKVELKRDIGATEVTHRALEADAIDVYPEYTGTILSVVKGERRIPQDPGTAYRAAQRFERGRGFRLLDMTPFENKDAVGMLETTAAAKHVSSLEDLRRLGRRVTLGGSPEYRTRFQGFRGLQDVYDLKARYRSVPIGRVYAALRAGRLTAGSVFTTDGELAADDVRLLTDPRGLFGAQNVAPLVSDDVLAEFGRALEVPLNRVSAALTTEAMQRMNAKASAGADPAAVARAFLRSEGLLDRP